MTPDHIQRMIDAAEARSAARYERQRLLMGMVDDAARRADAMSRLEAWLQRPRPRPDTHR